MTRLLGNSIQLQKKLPNLISNLCISQQVITFDYTTVVRYACNNYLQCFPPCHRHVSNMSVLHSTLWIVSKEKFQSENVSISGIRHFQLAHLMEEEIKKGICKVKLEKVCNMMVIWNKRWACMCLTNVVKALFTSHSKFNSYLVNSFSRVFWVVNYGQ